MHVRGLEKVNHSPIALRLAVALAALTFAFASAAHAEGDLFVPKPKPMDSAPKPAPEKSPAKPSPGAVLIGIWKLNAKGGLKCGDGTIQFSQSSSGRLEGFADVGLTDPSRDFREISVSASGSVTITYGFFFGDDPRVKTLRGQLDSSSSQIKGTEHGEHVDGCTFTMTKQ